MSETILNQETPAPTPEEAVTTVPETTEPTQDAPEDNVDGDADAALGAPEEYADFSLPENFEVDDAQLSDFKGLAKELNLPQDGAQKLVDFYTKAQADQVDASARAWETTVSNWATEAKNDPEYGGAAFQENLGLAKEALDYFGDDELKEVLDLTGVGNHKAMVRVFAKLGKAMKEDKIVLGHSKDAAPMGQADRLFPSMRK